MKDKWLHSPDLKQNDSGTNLEYLRSISFDRRRRLSAIRRALFFSFSMRQRTTPRRAVALKQSRMEKVETFLTETDCHRGCREDTKSSEPEEVTCMRSKFACRTSSPKESVVLKNHIKLRTSFDAQLRREIDCSSAQMRESWVENARCRRRNEAGA